MENVMEMEHSKVKLTRFCLLPWRFMQIHAGGMMQCCAVAPDTDEGDFILDYCENPEKGKDIFDNEGLQMLRHGLLTGNLRPMCRNCFFVPNELVTTEEFRKRLIASPSTQVESRSGFCVAKSSNVCRAYL